MINAIYGKKIGMTQIFDEAGKFVPVTVVEAGPCVVVQKKTVENDGYESIQVGFGDIAQATARRLGPFGCKLYYYSLHRRSPEVEAEFGVEYLPLEELAAACDILSLHCAVNDQTRNMVDAQLISKMNPGIILVNTARGDLVDNQALRKALIDGTIRGAALDTIFPEPTPGDHPLVDLPPEVRDRVVYSSHLGGSSGGAFAKAHLTMWTNARHILNGERPTNVVNGL